MDFRRLGYFLAVVDNGGFTSAARAVHVSQPALSLAVKELEREVGAVLFHRLGRSVRLTAAGEALVEPARQALRDVETGRAAVAAVGGLLAGRLLLCSLPTLAVDPVAELVGHFRRAHPAVVVELAAPEDLAELVELLRTGLSELAVADHGAFGDDYVRHELVEQRLLVVMPPGTPHRRGPVPLAELADAPIVAPPPGTSSRRLLEEGFSAVGVTPNVAVVTAQREAILPLVLAGAGLALVPEALAAVAELLGATVVEPEPAITRRIVVAHRPGPLAPAARRFLELALKGSGRPGGARPG